MSAPLKSMTPQALKCFLLFLITAAVGACSGEPSMKSDEAAESQDAYEVSEERDVERQEDSVQEEQERQERELRSEREWDEHDEDPDDAIVSDELEDALEETIEESIEEFSDQLEDVLSEVAVLIDEIVGESRRKEPAHVRDLMKLLPNDIDGLDLVTTDSKHHPFGTGGADVTAKFASDEVEASVSIIDPGALAPLVRKSAEWLDGEIDQESSDGFERTRRFRPRSGDYPAYESLTRISDDQVECAIMVWVADRFIVAVEVSGRGVEIDHCTDVRDSVSFRKLHRLAAALEDNR